MLCGGKERRLTELMKALVNMPGIHFELVIMNSEIYYKEVLELNIPIHYLIRKGKKDFFMFSRFYSLSKSIKPDVVHCWDSMTAVYLAPVCQILSIPLINGMVVDTPVQRNILNKHWLRARITFPFSQRITGNSKAGLEAYHAPADKSVAIYNGFNFERLNNVLVESEIKKKLKVEDALLVGMVATFSDYKDYNSYFTAAKILLRKGIKVVFCAIGDNTDSNNAHQLIGEEFMPHFRCLGKISDVESFVNAMDVCVLSTFSEGISNAILEYMALGKPVVATLGGGTNEIVMHNETGFLVPAANPMALAEKIELLLLDKTLRLTMGNAGKNRVREHFSIQKMVSGYLNIYNHYKKGSNFTEKPEKA